MPKRCTLIRERCKRKSGKRNKNNKKSRIWTSKVVLEDSTCDVQIIFKKYSGKTTARLHSQTEQLTPTSRNARMSTNIIIWKSRTRECRPGKLFFFSSNICSVLLVLLLRRRVASTGLQVIHHHLHAKFASASGGWADLHVEGAAQIHVPSF